MAKRKSIPKATAWMCLSHHDEYDTKKSQTKGYKISEAKAYRNKLYVLLEKEMEKITKTGFLNKIEFDSKLRISDFSVQILKYINNPVAQRTGGCSYIELTVNFTDKEKLDFHLKHLLEEDYITKNMLDYYVLGEKGKLFFYRNTL